MTTDLLINPRIMDWPPPNPFAREPFDRQALRKVVTMLSEARTPEEYTKCRDGLAQRFRVSPLQLEAEMAAWCPEVSKQYRQ